MERMQFSEKQQVVLLELGRMYDDNGYLRRDDARFACAMAGQEALNIFHQLEEAGVIQWASDGSLDWMPSDEQIKEGVA